MTPTEASRLLDLLPEATPEQLEIRFLELRTRLEEKIGKAPTPGLKEKYRASLADITTAFETLTLAADSSHLPVLNRGGSPRPAAVASQSSTANTTATAQTPVGVPPPTNAKSSGSREFLVVALIAVLLLGGGGWWIIKVRAENEEKARIVALQKEEALRLELAAKKEAERVSKLASELGARLAEAKVDWDAYQSNLADAERLVNELKSEAREQDRNDPSGKAERSARIASQVFYAEWLKNYLLRHPAKMTRARLEQLLQSKAVDEAKAVHEELISSLVLIAKEVESHRKLILQSRGSIRIESKPDGLKWAMVDTYGRESKGVTPSVASSLPLTHLPREVIGADTSLPEFLKLGEHTAGKVSVTLSRAGWEDVTLESTLTNQETKNLTFPDFPEGIIEIRSLPQGLSWEAKNDLGWKATGLTPETLKGVPPGKIVISVIRPGYAPAKESLDLTAGSADALNLDLQGQTMVINVEEKQAEIWVFGKLAGYGTATIRDLPLGNCQVVLKLKGFPDFPTMLPVEKGVKNNTQNFSFRELASQKHQCSSCEGKGLFERSRQCSNCEGTGRKECSNCHGSGSVVNLVAVFSNSLAEGLNSPQPKQQEKVTCRDCNGRGSVTCHVSACNRGIYRWTEKCESCGGDGLKSLLELQH